MRAVACEKLPHRMNFLTSGPGRDNENHSHSHPHPCSRRVKGSPHAAQPPYDSRFDARGFGRDAAAHAGAAGTYGGGRECRGYRGPKATRGLSTRDRQPCCKGKRLGHVGLDACNATACAPASHPCCGAPVRFRAPRALAHPERILGRALERPHKLERPDNCPLRLSPYGNVGRPHG